MKKHLFLGLLIFIVGGMPFAFSQGWHAVVELDFSHGHNALSSIDQAVISFSGATVSGSSSTSRITLSLTGDGTPSGPLYIYARGAPDITRDIYASYSGNIPVNCDVHYFEVYGYSTEDQYITGMVTIYPRLEITDFYQDCDQIRLATNTCSGIYTWQVSENLSGPFKTLTESFTPRISLTNDAFKNLGFSSPYGRKYIRVTGLTGTSSPLQPVDVRAPGPTATFTVTSPKCHDGADGEIKINIVSSYPEGIDDFIITPYLNNEATANIILNNTSVASIPDLKAGNYRLEIINNSNINIYGSCLTSYTPAPLINPPKITIPSFHFPDYNGYPIKCKGGSDGTLEANPSGGTGVYSAYEWTPDVSETNVAVNLSEGTYSVRVKDSNNCWSDEYIQALTAPEALSINMTATGGKGGFDVSCLDKTDGVISTNISGGVQNYRYAWSDGSSLNKLSGIGTGTYSLMVTDDNGCSNEESLILTAPPPIDFSIAQISEIICPGDHSGALEVQSPVNTIGEVYYSWSSGESGREITDKPAGSYSLTVSDEQGCHTTKSKILTEPMPYSLDLVTLSDYNGSPIRCSGEDNGKLTTIVRDENNTITTAGYYSWYKNGNELTAGTGHSTLDQLSAGIYRVEIEYREICKAAKIYVLKEPEPVLPLISNLTHYNGYPISCHGRSDGGITVTAHGGTGNSFTYTWDTGETGPVLSEKPEGKYTVIARDINGCEGNAEKVLTDPEPVTPDISVLSDFNGQSISCNAASDGRLRASANGGTGSFVYTWSTGDTGADLMGIPAGPYTLTATDLNGCASTIETTIENPPPVRAIIKEVSDYHGYGVSCSRSRDGYIATEGTGGTGVYKFSWEDNSHSESLYMNLYTGTYAVTLSDENGCSDSIQVTLTEPSPLSLEVSEVKNISCYDGDDGQIHLIADGGAGDYAYSSDSFTWQNHPTLTGLKAIPYQLLAKDLNGCEQSITQTLTQPPGLTLCFDDIEPAFCGEARGKATAIANGGTGDYRYEWKSSQNNILSNEKNISGLFSGVYTLTVFDNNNCEVINTVGITSADGPKVKVSDVVPATCSYSSDGSALLEITEGNGPFSLHWPDGQSALQGFNLSKGDHLVEITDLNDCKVIAPVTIPAPEALDITVVESAEPICNGDCNGKLTIMVNGGTGNYFYDWTEFTGPELNDLCAGDYSVIVTDENTCVSEKTFHLGQPEPLAARLLYAQSPDCRDGCDGRLEIEASGGTGIIQYLWSTGANDPDVHKLCAGTYSAIISDSHGCNISETYSLKNPEGSTLDLGGSITLCAGQTHMLDPGSDFESYAWASNIGFTSTLQHITIQDAGMYWLEAMDSKRCIVQDTFLLETTLDLLEANFLSTTEAMAGDTVALIDISWPLPDNAIWNFPVEMKRLDDFGDIVYGQFTNAGLYTISLTATLGGCRDEMTKRITILSGEEDVVEEGRIGHEPLVKEFILYPNPNDGMFDVSVEFLEKSPVVLSVWNIFTARKIGQVEDSGHKSYLKHIDLRPLSAGTYSVRLDYSEGTKYIRFIVR